MIAGLAAFAALAVAAPTTAAEPQRHGAAGAERQIRSQRAAFNDAIAKGEIGAISAVLAENAQLISGSDSTVYAGKSAQLAVWLKDFRAPSRGLYIRTPDRITLSPIAPMALETGHWRGVASKSAEDWASGNYVAKWRRIGGAWKIESETYMTLACGGSYCPESP